ncbi:hypothetical protein AB8A21_12735 [Streptomyces sp. BF23-18]
MAEHPAATTRSESGTGTPAPEVPHPKSRTRGAGPDTVSDVLV